jgi:hypothetical protein
MWLLPEVPARQNPNNHLQINAMNLPALAGMTENGVDSGHC